MANDNHAIKQRLMRMAREVEGLNWADRKCIGEAIAIIDAAENLALTSPVATEQAQAVAMAREALIDLIEENLYGVYHCGRVWEAWHVGTMSQDDFTEARGSALAPDLADAIIAKFAASPEAAPAAPTAAPMCRDCADFGPICPNSGKPCTPTAATPPKACEYCDDSGDVHGLDGEWRGICNCPAGDKFRTTAATPAAPSAETVSWNWLRGVINGLPSTPSGCYELIARHDVLAWIDEAELRSALAQPAPVQVGGVHELSEVVRLLRKQGHYEDEEGEATNRLADLLDSLKAAPVQARARQVVADDLSCMHGVDRAVRRCKQCEQVNNPVAQVVAIFPPEPDGHGVNWLVKNQPKPGTLLYLAAPVQAGAQPAAAYLLTRPSGFSWVLMPFDITPYTRAIFEAEGTTITPLHAAPVQQDAPAPSMVGDAFANLTDGERNILAVALLRFEEGPGHELDKQRAKAMRAAISGQKPAEGEKG